MYNKLLLLTANVCLILFSCKKELDLSDSGNLVPGTVAENSNLPSININGAKLHAQAFGPVDSNLIICIHGGPGDNYRYLLNCKSLSEKGYRVIFYDQRGSGLSERFELKWYKSFGESTIDKVFYDELTEVIKFYKTKPSQKVILLGHSWGAMLATGYAGKNSSKINGLIVAEPGGLKWDDIREYLTKSNSFGFWSEALTDINYINQFITGKENQHEVLDYKLALLSASNINSGDGKSDLGPNSIYYKTPRYGAIINTAMLSFGDKYKPDLSLGITQFQKKTLFIYGSNNSAYSDVWAQRVAAAYPDKDVFKVQGVGHSGMFDQINVWTGVTEPRILQYIRNL